MSLLARIRRCVGRSCQDYASEMTSLQRNNNASTSNISSCTTKSDKRNAFNEKPVLPRKHTSDPQRCILQGNGSCLNHYNGKENENMSSERKTESQSSSSLHLSARQGHCLSLVPSQMERQLGPSENEVQATKDFGRSTPKRTMKVEFKNITNQQLNQNMRRTMIALGKRPIDPSSSGSNHEKEEENADLCQSIPQRKRKVVFDCRFHCLIIFIPLLYVSF
ncbi:hypothetical protein MtrunA17_Chr1g0205011 [Medicago truncatula]|uniref:Uncharacterized protein n=1 Tax=Medicago truncatula TaxID=3880 RepID=A0A396K231_MEDTR|nr:hypothetical protein MtrunA17_Chr1g0205011 [Medicago truncatula]